MVPNKPGDDDGAGCMAIVLLLMMFILGAAIAGGCERRSWQRDAVRNGAAEWKVDDSGSVEFFWKERAK